VVLTVLYLVLTVLYLVLTVLPLIFTVLHMVLTVLYQVLTVLYVDARDARAKGEEADAWRARADTGSVYVAWKN